MEKESQTDEYRQTKIERQSDKYGQTKMVRQRLTKTDDQRLPPLTQHVGEVPAPILFLIDGANRGSVAVKIAIDDGGDGRKFRDEVHRVLVCVFPVRRLVTFVVVGSEGAG